MTALWSPFEMSQQHFIDAIHRLRQSAESEATAITVARHAYQNSAMFWELGKINARLSAMRTCTDDLG